jgi:hypothetical protein
MKVELKYAATKNGSCDRPYIFNTKKCSELSKMARKVGSGGSCVRRHVSEDQLGTQKGSRRDQEGIKKGSRKDQEGIKKGSRCDQDSTKKLA